MGPITASVLPLLLVLPGGVAERRGLAFLAAEVPGWVRENRCYSCHNTGVGATALFLAARAGRPVQPHSVRDLTEWLGRPRRWEQNGDKGPFSDKKLARLQFASALLGAADAGLIADPRAVREAALLVAAEQDANGAWRTDAAGVIGSPATLGWALATVVGKNVLGRADPLKYRESIARADRFVRAATVETVPDAAGVLLALGTATDPDATRQRSVAIKLLAEIENGSGAWGPTRNGADEVFDTAIAVLALRSLRASDATSGMIRRGREYLVKTQTADGSWPETTRPAGGTSYAQRVATTGWAVMALVSTADER